MNTAAAESPIHGDGPCALCGRNPSAGHATVTDNGRVLWLCHEAVRRSCYVRWTVYGERPHLEDHLDDVLSRATPAAVEAIGRLSKEQMEELLDDDRLLNSEPSWDLPDVLDYTRGNDRAGPWKSFQGEYPAADEVYDLTHPSEPDCDD